MSEIMEPSFLISAKPYFGNLHLRVTRLASFLYPHLFVLVRVPLATFEARDNSISTPIWTMRPALCDSTPRMVVKGVVK